MAKTTISVDSETRDRLARHADQHRRTLGDELVALLDQAEKRDFWAGVSAGYAGRDVEYDAAEEFPEYADLKAPGPFATPPDMVDDAPTHVGEAR